LNLKPVTFSNPNFDCSVWQLEGWRTTERHFYNCHYSRVHLHASSFHSTQKWTVEWKVKRGLKLSQNGWMSKIVLVIVQIGSVMAAHM
jgi:hypothetical protein